MVWKHKMILDLPGFITNQIIFDLIQCFNEEKKETHNKSACQVSYGRVLITKESACGFLKCGFL